MGPAPGVRRLSDTSTGMGRLFSTTSGALTTRSHPTQRTAPEISTTIQQMGLAAAT